MIENSLLQRLNGIEARFEEIGTLITDPAVIADMKRYVRLTRPGEAYRRGKALPHLAGQCR